MIDEGGSFHSINQAFNGILGWEPEEVIGRTVFHFVHPDDRALMGGALAEVTRGALPIVGNR